MNLFKKILKPKTNTNELKIHFDKVDNSWQVKKGVSIIYIGDKTKCETYLSYITS